MAHYVCCTVGTGTANMIERAELAGIDVDRF